MAFALFLKILQFPHHTPPPKKKKPKKREKKLSRFYYPLNKMVFKIKKEPT